MSSGSEGEGVLSSSDEEQINGKPLNPFNEQDFQEIKNRRDTSIPSGYVWKERVKRQVLKRLPEKELKLLDLIGSHKNLLCVDQGHSNWVLAGHLLNYTMKVRDLILKNNAKLMLNRTLITRDQGFTRPRILVLLPFKNSAFDLINTMISIWNSQENNNQVEQKKRFQEEYGRVVDSDGEEVEEDLSSKPLDYQVTFKGNIDDCFRIGVKVTRKALKLFTDFYASDIIIASPLGLKLSMDGLDSAKKGKKPDYDFLSSIELVVMSQSNVIAMQNWEHVTEIFEHLNLLPKESHGCDFSRVLSVFLDNEARVYRQTLLFSEVGFPELSALHDSCINNLGSTQIAPMSYMPSCKLAELKPEFHILRSSTLSPLEEAETRFKHFTEKILKTVTYSHCIVHCSNYFEFVRIKDYLGKLECVKFEALSEYSDQKQMTRARSRFYDGHVKVLLVTERLHFFHRFLFKGVKRVIFYSLPMHHLHFSEWTGMVQCRVKVAPIIVCTEHDRGKVERIFGSKGCAKIFNTC